VPDQYLSFDRKSAFVFLDLQCISNYNLTRLCFLSPMPADAHELLQDAMLSQGEPRDAAISFDTTAPCMRLLWHSMGFLYRPTSATVQMLKLHHTVR